MGMAASQARYLGLTARKTNVEYEGQQINQARTALANQSANAFNELLALEVPTSPSTQDYTTVQYSYKDGTYGETITSMTPISDDPDYNYLVTHYHNADVYTGIQTKRSNPQVVLGTSVAENTLAQGDITYDPAQGTYSVNGTVLQTYDPMSEEQRNKLDNYTYIPSQKNVVPHPIKENNRDNYTYIPSSKCTIQPVPKDIEKKRKYIPSQEGAKIQKSFDNSGLQSALDRAQLAEDKALKVLAGNFDGM